MGFGTGFEMELVKSYGDVEVVQDRGDYYLVPRVRDLELHSCRITDESFD